MKRVLAVLLAATLGGAPAAGPGSGQPLAPNMAAAPRLPEVVLNPPVPGLRRVEYMSNGHIEVANAVLVRSPGDQRPVRALLAQVARRVLAARPQLSEVDLSVYLGGAPDTAPIWTASVPRDRLPDLLAWARGAGRYERVWAASSQPADPLPASQPPAPDPLAGQLAEALRQARAHLGSGVQHGLLYRGDPARPLVALTFDDAPHPMYTPLLLDLLRREGLRATFFAIGRNARAYPYFVRDLLTAGHELGNHTEHHLRLGVLSEAALARELAGANRTLTALSGRPVRYFRAPGGTAPTAALHLARRLGLVTVYWTNDPADFQNRGPAVTLARLSRHLGRGGIVLLHDNAPDALGALPGLARLARERGIRLGTVGELIGSGK